MIRKQNSFLQMLAVVRQCCNAHQDVWSGNATFSDAFNNGIVVTETVYPSILAQQQQKSTGLTQDKQSKRDTLAGQLRFIAARIELYALNIADETLQRDAHLPPNKIKQAKDDALVGMVTRICGLATTNISGLGPLGLTAADVSALSAMGAEYAALIGTPARVRSSVREATLALKALLSQARAQLKIMDAHMVLWRDSHPDFYAEYFNARKIVDAAFRTRALELAVQDAAGHPLPGVHIAVMNTKLARRTSAKGVCRINHFPEGLHKAQLKAAGFALQELTFSINKGETTKLQAVMVKDLAGG